MPTKFVIIFSASGKIGGFNLRRIIGDEVPLGASMMVKWKVLADKILKQKRRRWSQMSHERRNAVASAFPLVTTIWGEVFISLLATIILRYVLRFTAAIFGFTYRLQDPNYTGLNPNPTLSSFGVFSNVLFFVVWIGGFYFLFRKFHDSTKRA